MSDVRSNMAAATTAAFKMARLIKVKVFLHFYRHDKKSQTGGMFELLLVSAIFWMHSWGVGGGVWDFFTCTLWCWQLINRPSGLGAIGGLSEARERNEAQPTKLSGIHLPALPDNLISPNQTSGNWNIYIKTSTSSVQTSGKKEYKKRGAYETDYWN